VLREILAPVLTRMPPGMQFELRRLRFQRQIRAGRFMPHEPEFAELGRYLHAGDWAIDVGANVGHYTCRMAQCVGVSGRILAFEPIPTSFALLAVNLRAAGARNVSLFNAALSSETSIAGMTVPTYDDGLRNYYRARISSGGDFPVLCLKLDSIQISGQVRLVKIDAEGHDLKVLMGMEGLLYRDHPVLIVEASLSGPVAEWLGARGYSLRQHAGSPNIVAEPQAILKSELHEVYATAGH
jgi:FkbM family methyltransferase